MSDPPGHVLLLIELWRNFKCLLLLYSIATSFTSSALLPINNASLTLSIWICPVVIVGLTQRIFSISSLSGSFACGVQLCLPIYITLISLWQRSFSTYLRAQHSTDSAGCLQWTHFLVLVKSTLFVFWWIFRNWRFKLGHCSEPWQIWSVRLPPWQNPFLLQGWARPQFQLSETDAKGSFSL